MTTLSQRRTRRLLAVSVLALLPAFATCGWGEAQRGAATGDSIPDFELATLDGERLGPSDLEGKVVLYDFWATWCVPCHAQVEVLAGLRARAEAAGVVFVAIDTGEPEKVVRDYLAKKPYPYTVLLDVDEAVSTQLDVLGLPTLVVTDAAGRIVWRQTGLADESAILAALARAGARLATPDSSAR